MVGRNDINKQELKEDELKMLPYVEGLYDYICECEMPMAIAIQGAWGSGKTSVIEMLKNKITEENLLKPKTTFDTFSFNPWEDSQFQSEENVSLSFLKEMIKTVIPKNEKTQERIKKVKDIISNLAISMAKKYTNEMVSDAVEKMVRGDENETVYSQMKTLAASFKEFLDENPKDRIVIFVDDMDRIKPAMAVELLELFKFVFNHEKCIFVLAIDTEIVYLGIKEKYGDNISDEKAKAFFDKMIQLPFTIPAMHNKTQKYLGSLMPQEVNEVLTSNEDKVWLHKLLYLYTKDNPREIKRYTNSVMLACDIENKKRRDENGFWVRKEINPAFMYKYILFDKGFSLYYPEIYKSYMMNMGYTFIYDFYNSDYEQLAENRDFEEVKKLLYKLGFYDVEIKNDEMLQMFKILYELICEFIMEKQFYNIDTLNMELLANYISGIDEEIGLPVASECEYSPYFDWVNRILNSNYYSEIDMESFDYEKIYYYSRKYIPDFDKSTEKDFWVLRLRWDEIWNNTVLEINAGLNLGVKDFDSGIVEQEMNRLKTNLEWISLDAYRSQNEYDQGGKDIDKSKVKKFDMDAFIKTNSKGNYEIAMNDNILKDYPEMPVAYVIDSMVNIKKAIVLQ